MDGVVTSSGHTDGWGRAGPSTDSGGSWGDYGQHSNSNIEVGGNRREPVDSWENQRASPRPNGGSGRY